MEKNLKTHVMKLSEEIGERNYVYYEELNKAADYLTEEFKRYGYDPSAQEYTIDNRVFKNIIAVKEGKIKPEEIVIIGAHYDSVIGSPGANDNGSAVAAMLELARMFSKVDTERTVKFIAFTNEEPPFYLTGQMGSRIYAKSARERGDDIKAMVSLETIGYYSEARNSQSYPFFYGLFYPDQANFIGVVGNFGSGDLVKKVRGAFEKNSDFPIESVTAPNFVPGVNFSDHDSFWTYGYKACMVTDTAFYRYPYYHSMEDTYDKVVYPKLTEVVKGLYYVVLDLSRTNPGNPAPIKDSAVLVPIGDVDRELLERLAKVLSERFDTTFSIGETLEIPEETYDPKRDQYYSSAILEILRKEYSGKKILGVIDKDLYVPDLNFVFGEAYTRGGVALISITRLKQEYYGLPGDDKLFFERTVKEAVHELGHAHGLGHCSDPNCVMFFSNSLMDTDRKNSSFCKSCQGKYDRY